MSITHIDPNRLRTMAGFPLGASTHNGMVNSFKESGQYEPIKITPDGRITDGLQRARAARELGRKVICDIDIYISPAQEYISPAQEYISPAQEYLCL